MAERREWLQSTPAGVLQTVFGADEVDHDAVDARVEEVRRHHLRTYGRELTNAELSAVRTGAELRSAVPVARPIPVNVPELVAEVNARMVSAGWSYVPEFRRGQGMAMRQPDGSWSGDPVVVERVRAAEADRAARDAAAGEAWANGPAIMRTIARPS